MFHTTSSNFIHYNNYIVDNLITHWLSLDNTSYVENSMFEGGSMLLPSLRSSSSLIWFCALCKGRTYRKYWYIWWPTRNEPIIVTPMQVRTKPLWSLSYILSLLCLLRKPGSIVQKLLFCIPTNVSHVIFCWKYKTKFVKNSNVDNLKSMA